MGYYVPAKYGVVDLMLDAMVSLLTDKCIDEIPTGDVSRAQIIKAGYRQESPDSVSIMIYENDPDDPKQNKHRPKRDAFTGSRAMVGGGNRYSRAFTIEVEIYGRYMPITMTREETRRVASIVSRRIMTALNESGPRIGQDRRIEDDFGESVVNGPHFAQSWADVNEGESLIVRKYIRVWYETSCTWSTDDW